MLTLLHCVAFLLINLCSQIRCLFCLPFLEASFKVCFMMDVNKTCSKATTERSFSFSSALFCIHDSYWDFGKIITLFFVHGVDHFCEVWKYFFCLVDSMPNGMHLCWWFQCVFVGSIDVQICRSVIRSISLQSSAFRKHHVSRASKQLWLARHQAVIWRALECFCFALCWHSTHLKYYLIMFI